jgi:hypothetical protein
LHPQCQWIRVPVALCFYQHFFFIGWCWWSHSTRFVFHWSIFFSFFWDTVSLYSQAGLKLEILLPQPLECVDYRCVLWYHCQLRGVLIRSSLRAKGVQYVLECWLPLTNGLLVKCLIHVFCSLLNHVVLFLLWNFLCISWTQVVCWLCDLKYLWVCKLWFHFLKTAFHK